MKKLLLSALVLLCFSAGSFAQKRPAKVTKAPQSRLTPASAERVQAKMEVERTGTKAPATVSPNTRFETIEVDQPKSKAVKAKN